MWFGRLTAVMSAIGSCLVMLIMAVILIDVGGRYFFNDPLEGVPEIVAMSIAAIVFLQFPNTLRAGRVIMVDGLTNSLAVSSPRTEQALFAIYHLAGGLVFAVITWAVVPLLGRTIENEDFFGVIGVFTFPKWPIHSTILFGCVVMTLQYLLLAWGYARAALEGKRLNADHDPADRILS